MKYIIFITTICIFVICSGYAQQDRELFDTGTGSLKYAKSPVRSFQLKEGEGNTLESIELLANSSGPLTPHFIYKGVVTSESTPFIADSAAFTSLINGSSMSSISPDDNGQFYISQGSSPDIYYMINWIENAKTPLYEIRFESDNAGLAYNKWGSGAIHQVPFTVWDLNGTPGNTADDIQMLVITNSLDDDSTWGIKSGYPASWTANPAQESDWIYIYSFNEGITYNDVQSAYQTQISSGFVDSDLYDTFRGNLVFRRITINSLDSNPLSTINTTNGLPRPAPGTVIRWSLNINLFFNEANLYTVVGQPFIYEPNVSGWPKPNISAIQLPSGMTIDASGVLNWTPDASQWGWHAIVLQANSIQGSDTGWYAIWVDAYPWEYKDHNNNNIVSSVFNCGKVGSAWAPAMGSGFQYINQNGLYEGDLIIAVSDSQISGKLNSNQNENSWGTGSPVKTITSPIAGFDQSYEAEFNDYRADWPMELNVIQTSYSKSTTPDDDYIILDYEIHNEGSTPIDNVYVGLSTDWDVGDYVMNLGGYDPARKLNYVYEQGGVDNPNYYGVAILNTNVSGNAFQVSFDDSVLFTQMKTFESPPTQTGEDMRSLITSGPFNIEADDFVRVVFAVLAGSDLADIQANADAALQVNLTRRPILAVPQDGATDVALDPVLYWSPALGAITYEAQVASDAGFTNMVWSLSGIADTSEQAFGLDGGATYYWRVNATDGQRTSTWSPVWSFTTKFLPEVTTQSVSGVGQVSARLHGTINPKGHRVAVNFEYGEDQNYGNDIPATPDTITGTQNVAVSALVNWLHTDKDYHYRVVARNVDGSFTVNGNDLTFHTSTYATSINISTSVPFPSYTSPADYQATDYRLIGIPGKSDTWVELSSLLGGTGGTDWQAYWDNGIYSSNANDYLVKYDGSAVFTFGDGRAFWVVNKGPLTINVNGLPTVTINSNEEAVINLHDGFNLITNPFNGSIAWWEIQQVNSFNQPLYSFSGVWNEAELLMPYAGYIFDNANNLPSLKIPLGASLLRPALNNEFDWKVKISLTVNNLTESSTSFGVSPNAKYGRDEFDFKKPRAVGGIPSVHFIRPQWDETYTIFATDIRSPFTDIQNWSFNVSSPVQQQAELCFMGINDVPEKFEVFLINRINSTVVNLRENNTCQFIPVSENSNFELVVGKHEYVSPILEKIVPSHFALGKNFPNPFNPSTFIPVEVPHNSKIKIKVYDILGKEIKTIYDGNVATGKHCFIWDGSNYSGKKVAAGVYLYKLITQGGENFVGKMVMIN